MKKILLHLSFICVALCALVACKEPHVYRIGVSQPSRDDWRTKMNDEIRREILLHEDAEVEIRTAGDDNNKQIEDIRYFADKGFDVIIVSPNEAAALTPVIDEVYAKGFPVIIFDRNILSDSYTARIGVDDEGLGRSAARYARHLVGDDAKAIEIYGRVGSTPAEGRHKGFVDEFCRGGARLLASVPGNWNKDDALPAIDSLLDIYDDVDLIYAHNDRMAIGASEVARRRGRDSIRIIGIDAAPNIGIKAVADGVIDATFLYPTEGHRLVQTALAILKGEPYEREVHIPLSSAVDRTNADILLFQNEALAHETHKMNLLKQQVDAYWDQHSAQTSLFYALIVILILLFGVAFLLLRAFWQRSRHQKALLEQNKLLEAERDKQKDLNEQLQEATQSKLVFFTNVSHDLRTPLTLIAEPVAQLAGAPNLTERQRTLMKIADKNVKILQRLINQILDFRKYENGKLELNLTEIDFHKAIEDWTESFYSVAASKDIKLRLQKPEGEGAEMMLALDAEKIERVYFNLLSNAIKYTQNNGTITVSYSCSGDELRFSVADTGQGISERDMGNIFDRFFQVDRVHPRGSGIGLSLAKAFVELHGGTITVDSILNKGSVFTVILPVRHTDAPCLPPAKAIAREDVETELRVIDEPSGFESDKPILLIIDDNADIRQLIRELLGDTYNVISAANGLDGVKMAVKYVPDIVVCDVMMPVLDGMDCCKRIKSEVSTSHIPVLMLTACSLDEQRVQGYDSGADAYLAKPFNAEVLAARCKALIDNRRRIRELWQGRTPDESPRKAAPEAPLDIESEFYRRVLDIIRQDMASPELSVDSIASKMGLERSQLYRKIKALTNYSPVELIRHIRLKQARQLVTTTDKTISEIAYEIGFSTPAYFTKCYREAFGETPTEARARVGK